MKRKLFVIVATAAVLISLVAVVEAGRPEHSLGAVFNDHGSLVGVGFCGADGCCGASWDLGDIYDVDDFVRVNPDGTSMSKINEQEVTIWLSDAEGNDFQGVGSLNRNWMGTYGVWVNARGEVSNGFETMKVQCMLAIDEDTGEWTVKRTIR